MPYDAVVAKRFARYRSSRRRVSPILGFGARQDVSEQDHGEDGHAQHDGGARDGGQLQPLGKGLVGRVEQRCAERIGEFAGRRRGADQSVAHGLRRLGRNPLPEGIRHLAAVDGVPMLPRSAMPRAPRTRR